MCTRKKLSQESFGDINKVLQKDPLPYAADPFSISPLTAEKTMLGRNVHPEI
jgi:hypothetical protein